MTDIEGNCELASFYFTFIYTGPFHGGRRLSHAGKNILRRDSNIAKNEVLFRLHISITENQHCAAAGGRDVQSGVWRWTGVLCKATGIFVACC
ncbi:hypothetical protein [Rugamonas aquatica]|uniref:Uncharacterized protein n=1 Tax=Rugamonas aquatica TaxID=2743357 RepID=A0A6A7NE69_9BURK|nr:hypothetical protein [Rugamonas aquatica]MQA42657.1 hypothetical protein [Rugamonas aquatica]